MLKDDRIVKSYSESFKLKVLTEIESGKYSKRESQRIYGYSSGAIYKWMKKYDKFALMNKRLKIETLEEKDKIKALEKEIAQLKAALVKKDLKLYVNECYLEVAQDKLGYKDSDEFKKKLDELLLKKQ